MLGVAVLFMMSRISMWVWAFPIILVGTVGIAFTIVRYDKIIVAKE
jgi:hypothetical protein